MRQASNAIGKWFVTLVTDSALFQQWAHLYWAIGRVAHSSPLPVPAICIMRDSQSGRSLQPSPSLVSLCPIVRACSMLSNKIWPTVLKNNPQQEQCECIILGRLRCPSYQWLVGGSNPVLALRFSLVASGSRFLHPQGNINSVFLFILLIRLPHIRVLYGFSAPH